MTQEEVEEKTRKAAVKHLIPEEWRWQELALKKLEELGYKPKKRVEKKDSEKEIAELLKNIENNEARKQILDLLIEALSEPDPREILIYGMYVKKCLSPVIRPKTKDHIVKTMEILTKAVGKA